MPRDGKKKGRIRPVGRATTVRILQQYRQRVRSNLTAFNPGRAYFLPAAAQASSWAKITNSPATETAHTPVRSHGMPIR